MIPTWFPGFPLACARAYKAQSSQPNIGLCIKGLLERDLLGIPKSYNGNPPRRPKGCTGLTIATGNVSAATSRLRKTEWNDGGLVPSIHARCLDQSHEDLLACLSRSRQERPTFSCTCRFDQTLAMDAEMSMAALRGETSFGTALHNLLSELPRNRVVASLRRRDSAYGLLNDRNKLRTLLPQNQSEGTHQGGIFIVPDCLSISR